jgi:hypothetical protein
MCVRNAWVCMCSTSQSHPAQTHNTHVLAEHEHSPPPPNTPNTNHPQSLEEVDEIARRPNSIPVSCSLKLNMTGLLERIWEMMALVGAVLEGGEGRGGHNWSWGAHMCVDAFSNQRRVSGT